MQGLYRKRASEFQGPELKEAILRRVQTVGLNERGLEYGGA